MNAHIIRGECGCIGVQVGREEADTSGVLWTPIKVLYSCAADGSLGFDQLVRNPASLPPAEAGEEIANVAKQADRWRRDSNDLASMREILHRAPPKKEEV